MHDLTVDHLRHAIAAGIHLVPKHHQVLHMTDRACDTGNPYTFANFYDESLNKDLALVAAGAHAAVFERRVFAHFKSQHEAKARKRTLRAYES